MTDLDLENGQADIPPQLALKASRSLEESHAQITKHWLSSIIDDLDLASLQTFPTAELSSSLPKLISYFSRSLSEPAGAGEDRDAVSGLAESISALDREASAPDSMFLHYAILKQALLQAVARDMRSSDAQAMAVFERFDRSFMEFLKAGIESYLDRSASRLQHLANTDALTGLFNIRYFRRQLHDNLEMFKRYQVPFSLMMLDLNRLKQINDGQGHGAGDRALKHLARIMMKEKREMDIAARYGGDEFFLILPGTLTEDAESLGRRIAESVNEVNRRTAGREMTSVSIGIASCPDDGTEVATLRAKADRALYLAKKKPDSGIASFSEAAE
jgi:diguanylate cyclase (GGDEF)-like protein